MQKNLVITLIFIVVLVLVLGFFGYMLLNVKPVTLALPSNPTVTTATTTDLGMVPEGQVQYSCAQGKVFVVWYSDTETKIALRDDQILTLTKLSSDPQRGLQFESVSEKIVLWAKGKSASVEQNGTTTYAACVAL